MGKNDKARSVAERQSTVFKDRKPLGELTQVATRLPKALVKKMRIECAQRGLRVMEFISVAIEHELGRSQRRSAE